MAEEEDTSEIKREKDDSIGGERKQKIDVNREETNIIYYDNSFNPCRNAQRTYI